jgi:hypothetical protein
MAGGGSAVIDGVLVGTVDDMDCDVGNDSLNSVVDGVVNNDRLDGETDTDTCFGDPDPEVNSEA